jgi:tetratricopeptide (TPR) repeat protein
MKKCLSLLFLLVACSSPQKLSMSDAEKDYGLALKLTESAQAEKAIKAWDEFLNKYPTTKLTASALYQKAYSLEQIGQYVSAVNSYRSAIVIWGTQNGKDRAQALLRISAAYESLGENAKSMAALRELEMNRGILTDIQKDIEVPARKALLYAKEANQQEAKKYYRIASRNMNQYLRKTGASKNAWLGEILFRLSETDPALSLPDFKTALDSLAINQSYLAKVIEMEEAYWSKRASDRLQLQYDGLKIFVQNFVKAEDVLERREQEEAQKDMAASLIDLLDKLPQEFLPNSSVYEAQIEFYQLQSKQQMQEVLLTRKTGEGLTNEAKERQGIKAPERIQELPPKVPTKPDPNL